MCNLIKDIPEFLSHHRYTSKLVSECIASIPAMLVAIVVFGITYIKDSRKRKTELATELIGLCSYRRLTVFSAEKSMLKLKSFELPETIIRFSDRIFDTEKIYNKINADMFKTYIELRRYISKEQSTVIKQKLLEIEGCQPRDFDEIVDLPYDKKMEFHTKYMKTIADDTGQRKLLIDLIAYLSKEFTSKKKYGF